MSEQIFTKLEIELVQQVANQCAIAIRQARLYEAVRKQIKELVELLNASIEVESKNNQTTFSVIFMREERTIINHK